VGFPPPDQDPLPKLAPMSASDPSAQVQQELYWFTGECFLKKDPNLSSTGPGRENKEIKRINFNFLSFFENWVSHSTPLKKNSTSNSDASIGTTNNGLKNQQNSPRTKSSGYFYRISSLSY
jgi:CRISPR/Cas system CSM-associated protein Csm4 (group 5 of RAMP superfamily)